MIQNYLTVVNALNSFSTAHASVHRFKCSFFEQLDNFSTSGNSFPILYAIPNEVSFEENIDNMSFRIYCLDILQKDRENETTILNDTYLVLRDLTNWLRLDTTNDLNVLNTPRAIPVNNFLVDFTTGWYIDVEVEVSSNTSECAIPFSSNFQLSGINCDFSYTSPFLTCSTVTGCTVLQEYIVNQINNSLTGGTGGGFSGWTASTGVNSIVANNGTNSVAGDLAIAGGTINLANGNRSFIGNGLRNSATTQSSSVLNGLYNLASGQASSVIGGAYNTASGGYSSVVGGTQNIASGTRSFVGGGQLNSATTNSSFVGGGNLNLILSSYAAIVGGQSNKILPYNSGYAFIGAGYGNITDGYNSTIVAGKNNKTTGSYGFIGAGLSNLATTNSAVVGGYANSATSVYSSVVGGYGNINYSSGSIIGGGIRNLILNYSNCSFIGAGTINSATTAYATVINGKQNLASGQYSIVGAGRNNIASGTYSFVGGGRNNIAKSLANTIVGGVGNYTADDYSFVGGGKYNISSGNCSFVGAGIFNKASGTHSLIGNGYINSATTSYSSVLNGKQNIASGTYSFIGSGARNSATTQYSVVVGGANNLSNGAYSFLGAGFGNKVNAGYSSVLGGKYNTVNGMYSSIAGGLNNLVTGNYSVVLGGRNISATTNDTAFVPGLNIGTVGSGTSQINLGLDANGNVVTGSTSSLFSGTTNYYSKFTSGGSLSNGFVRDNGSSGLFIAPSGDNVTLAIVSPSGFYYPNLTFVNNGVTNVGSITAYGGRLYTSPLSLGGTIDMGANKIVNMSPATHPDDAINLGQLSTYFQLSGGTVTGSTEFTNGITANTIVVGQSNVGNANSAETVNLSLYDQYTYTLTGNTTFTFSNNGNGKNWTIGVKQSISNSGLTATFTATTASVKWQNSVTPVMSPNTGATDIFSFVQLNSIIYGSYIQNF